MLKVAQKWSQWIPIDLQSEAKFKKISQKVCPKRMLENITPKVGHLSPTRTALNPQIDAPAYTGASFSHFHPTPTNPPK